MQLVQIKKAIWLNIIIKLINAGSKIYIAKGL